MADADKQDHEIEAKADTDNKDVKPTKNERTKASGNKLKKLWQWLLNNRKVSIPLAIVLVVALLAAVPFTRYTVAGLFWKQDITVVVQDSQTKQPVSSALVTFKGVSKSTDNKGNAKLHVPVGSGELSVTKLYYKTVKQNITATINKPSPFKIAIEAVGRPVPLTVVNKISGKPIENVTIKAEKTQVKTDKNGQVVMVLPADKAEVSAVISIPGYNESSVKIKVTAGEDPANKFSITPTGKLYFLSNASGKLDVVKSDLDGENRQTVLPGTGNEDRNNTYLLASRDWKYIALYSKRDGGEYPKLFLIETDTDKLTTIDEGKATFEIRGWSGDRLIYLVGRVKNVWEGKQGALKSYQASTKKLTILDETVGVGTQSDYAYESITGVYVVDQTVVYSKNWTKGPYFYYGYTGGISLQDKKATFNSTQADGSQKKIVKSYDFSSSNSSYLNINTRQAEFGEIYIQYFVDNKAQYDEYEEGKITASKITDDSYSNETYPTYVVSPSGKKTLWSDYRDGKNVIFVGDGEGKNGKQIGSSEDYNVYGWYTDDYLLLTKKSSEMRIISVDAVPADLDNSFKVTNYYKPNYYNQGFGYGYGG